MKQVYLAMSLADAELVAQRLRGAGITAVVQQASPIPVAQFPSVWVPDDAEGDAREVLSLVDDE